MVYFTYMLRCSDGTFYTGFTVDLLRRVLAHNAGTGARYTGGRLPVVLVWACQWDSEPAARRAEWYLKQLSRVEKSLLVSGQVDTIEYAKVRDKLLENGVDVSQVVDVSSIGI